VHDTLPGHDVFRYATELLPPSFRRAESSGDDEEGLRSRSMRMRRF
jgi:hypothetical protein